MDNPQIKLLKNYNYPKDPKNPELFDNRLQVFFYENDDVICQRICLALSSMLFPGQFVFAQFWAAIYFNSAAATVLSTRGQPFAHSVYTDEFWSYRIRCLDQNSYVNLNTNVCIGVPARVYLNRYPEWTQDTDSSIPGSFAMPVFDGKDCIGVLDFFVTNLKDNGLIHEMREVCRALEKVGLQSLVPNENINRDISKDYSSLGESSNGTRTSKSCDVTCNDITKLFGMPKADAAKICGLSENTFTKVHRRFGIDEWPCIRKGVGKSSAHNALELGRVYHPSPDETQKIKHINDLVIKDDDDIDLEDGLVEEYMNYLLSNDGN